MKSNRVDIDVHIDVAKTVLALGATLALSVPGAAGRAQAELYAAGSGVQLTRTDYADRVSQIASPTRDNAAACESRAKSDSF